MSKKSENLFSVRNGFVKPSELLIVGSITPEISNAISSALIRMMQKMDDDDTFGMHLSKLKEADKLGQYIWTHLMHKTLSSYQNSLSSGREKIDSWIISSDTPWYQKLDLVEFVIRKTEDHQHSQFIKELNEQFAALGFAYRIMQGCVVDIVSGEELQTVESAMIHSSDAVKTHLEKALQLHTKRPKGEYADSIKESISAVEAHLRQLTGKNTLGEALKALEARSTKLHPRLKSAITQLYAYTNQPDTGIRQSLMETTSDYIPTGADSLYMMIVCSAFINYIKARDCKTSA